MGTLFIAHVNMLEKQEISHRHARNNWRDNNISLAMCRYADDIRIKFHISSSNESLINAIKPKDKKFTSSYINLHVTKTFKG